MSNNVESISEIFCKPYLNKLNKRRGAIAEYLNTTDVYEQNFHCNLTPSEKSKMTEKLLELIEYIVTHQKLATNYELCKKYGFPNSNITRSSKLRHNDENAGFFPLKTNSITGTGNTPFDDSEYIFFAQGIDAIPSYMKLGVRNDPGAPAEARGKMDAYGLTCCRRIKDYDGDELFVYLNGAYQPKSKLYKKGISELDSNMMIKIMKVIIIPMVKLYCNPNIREELSPDELYRACLNPSHRLHDLCVCRIPPLGYEGDPYYAPTGHTFNDTIFWNYGFKGGKLTGERNSQWGGDRYFVQLLSPTLKIIEHLLNGQKEVAPDKRMLKKKYNDLLGGNIGKIKIMGYWAPEIKTSRGKSKGFTSFHNEIAISVSLFDNSVRRKYFRKRTADCNMTHYVYAINDFTKSLNYNSSDFGGTNGENIHLMTLQISEDDAKLVIKEANEILRGRGYPMAQVPRHYPPYNYWEKFSNYHKSGMPVEDADSQACLETRGIQACSDTKFAGASHRIPYYQRVNAAPAEHRQGNQQWADVFPPLGRRAPAAAPAVPAAAPLVQQQKWGDLGHALRAAVAAHDQRFFGPAAARGGNTKDNSKDNSKDNPDDNTKYNSKDNPDGNYDDINYDNSKREKDVKYVFEQYPMANNKELIEYFEDDIKLYYAIEPTKSHDFKYKTPPLIDTSILNKDAISVIDVGALKNGKKTKKKKKKKNPSKMKSLVSSLRNKFKSKNKKKNKSKGKKRKNLRSIRR
jgi:hypothetical protein